MKKLKRGLLWFFLTCKRLLKKPGFVILLCSVPILVLAMQPIMQEESGMLDIVLFQENQEDELSSKIVMDLLGTESVLHYELVATRKEADAAVRNGNADAAWIFPDRMQQRLEEYIAGAYDVPVIKIIEREDNVALKLSREKLYGALYSYFPYMVYENFIRDEIMAETEVSDEELQADYIKNQVEGNLFQLAYLSGEPVEKTEAESNYLTAPVRGLLALLVILCGLAAAMYFFQDEEAGVFAAIPIDARQKYLYGYLAAAMLYAGAAVLTALFFSGQFRGIRELGWMLLYLLMCVGFCSVLKKLCGTLQRLGTCIPLLMMGMLVLCPVFFAVRRFRMLQCLLPPFYYLNGVHNTRYIWKMVAYCIIIFGVDILLDRAINRQKI